MICKQCAEVGATNRIRYEMSIHPDAEVLAWDTTLVEHPQNCGCPCMHKTPTQWEDMFSVPQPGKAM